MGVSNTFNAVSDRENIYGVYLVLRGFILQTLSYAYDDMMYYYLYYQYIINFCSMFLLKEYEVSQFSEISGILEACMITAFGDCISIKMPSL